MPTKLKTKTTIHQISEFHGDDRPISNLHPLPTVHYSSKVRFVQPFNDDMVNSAMIWIGIDMPVLWGGGNTLLLYSAVL